MPGHIRIITSPAGVNQPHWSASKGVRDWDSFVEWVRKPGVTGGKYARPYSPVSLRAGEKRRRNVNLETRHVLTLDADSAGGDYLDRLAEVWPGASLSHTTASHTADAPRWRTLIPLSREATPEEAKTLSTHMVDLIGRERFDVVASTSPIAVAYAPAWDDVAYEERDGSPLDVDGMLLVADPVAWEPADAEGAQTIAEFLDEHRPRDLESLPSCHYGRTALDAVVEELAATVEGHGVHPAIFSAAARFVEMVLAGCWSSRDMDRLADVAVSLRAEQRPEEWADALGNALRKVGGPKSGCTEHADESPVIPPRRSDKEDWFLSAILPTRSYGILSGPIGSGKSSVAGYAVADLTQKGFRVRYCVEDEPEASARHRLELLKADMSLVRFDAVPDLSTEAAIEAYARDCAEDGVDLAVFDLLTTANVGYEENSPEKVKHWVGKIVERFCHKYGVGVLGTHHWNNNSKAGSVMARLSGAGAIAAKAEFLWSVAISNDKSEQVWSIHARRRVSKAMNFEMKGTRHIVGVVAHPFKKSETLELDVYTVAYGQDTYRTAHEVVADAEREFSRGKTSKEKTPMDALRRFLEKPRRRAEVDEFLYLTNGERYSAQTVVDRMRDAGAEQCTAEGEIMDRGKYWIMLSPLDENP